MKAWEDFLAKQEQELGIETVNKWLKPLKVVSFDACNLYLEAKDSFQALWFEEHVRQKVIAQLFNNNQKRIRVHLTIANLASRTKKPIKPTKENEKSLPSFNPTFDDIDPLCTFDRFVVSEGHIVPLKLLMELCSQQPGQDYSATFNPIFLYGPNGAGKSHLLMATAQAMRANGFKVIYVRAETFTEHVVTAIRSGEMNVFRQAYRTTDVLLLDNVHVFSKKAATQEEFFHTFNTLHMAGKQIIISSDIAPQELPYIEPRLISRFEWGIVLPLEPLRGEDVSAVLMKKAESLHYPLHPKVAEFLIETFSSSAKSMVRALEALILRSHLNQENNRLAYAPMTVALAKHYLADLILEEQQNALTPQKIVHATSEYFGIRSEDVLGKAQSRDCALPRQIAMYLCRTELKMPFTKIGDLFSRDHSTVMSSVKLVSKGIELRENELISAIGSITKKLH